MRYSLTALAATATLAAVAQAQNRTYQNPIIPGFHPDPSCIFVPEWDDTFFCAVSSFIAFPAMPIFASRDLTNWKLISHVQNRPSQFPAAGNISSNSGGWYAPTLRYHEGTFYVINVDVDAPVTPNGGIFTTQDPYDDAAWSDLLGVEVGGYDPDIFFDSDGTVYSQAAITINSDPFTTEIQQFTIDLSDGSTTPREFLTNGTNVQPPEGPHMYFRDGWYYLLLAEGGTALGHQVTISRSRSPSGPFSLDPANPILTAQGTDSIFQTVGHADLFQDGGGNWWGVALSTRSGPEYVHWPLNRETVLYPVSWPEGQDWPIPEPVSGIMEGPLPPQDLDLPGTGPFVKDPDHYTFPPGSSLPRHFTFWRFPQDGKYTVSPPGHENTLRLLPSNANLTGSADFNPPDGQTFVARRQTDTLFNYTIDMAFSPSRPGDEAGVTIFHTQDRHGRLGLIRQPNGQHQLHFHAEGPNAPADVTKDVPATWCKQGVSFDVSAVNFTHYALSAGLKGSGEMQTLAYLDNAILSDSHGGVRGDLCYDEWEWGRRDAGVFQ